MEENCKKRGQKTQKLLPGEEDWDVKRGGSARHIFLIRSLVVY